MNFKQTADKMMETFNPHPSAASMIRKHKSHRAARKHLKTLGCTKSEQSKVIRSAKKQDPSWPPRK